MLRFEHTNIATLAFPLYIPYMYDVVVPAWSASSSSSSSGQVDVQLPLGSAHGQTGSVVPVS